MGANEAWRDNPGAYVRDRVRALANNPTIKKSIFEAMQGVRSGH